MKMYYEASLAGTWGSLGSTLGKLSGTAKVVSNSYILWTMCLAAMVVANTWSCRHYLRSLDAAANSVAPTVISAASSFVFSGVIGTILFGESTSLLWWCGASLIAVGLSLLVRHEEKQKST